MRHGPNSLDRLPGNTADFDDPAFLCLYAGLKMPRVCNSGVGGKFVQSGELRFKSVDRRVGMVKNWIGFKRPGDSPEPPVYLGK
jgi:hypothetical protein